VIGQTEVRAALNEIVDPCSRAAGAPAGLTDMGLVRRISVRDRGARVDVVLALTEPTCLMGFPFLRSARERISALPGVERVEVSLDSSFEWTPAELSPAYAARLEDMRATRREWAARDSNPEPRG
jgi:metal-sulfur cluster biosynthetic enzyme